MKTIIGPQPEIAVRSHTPRAVLNRLVGQALLNADFCRQLLNGSRAEILKQQAENLTQEERVYVMAVQADTLHDFAQALATQFPAGDGDL